MNRPLAYKYLTDYLNALVEELSAEAIGDSATSYGKDFVGEDGKRYRVEVVATDLGSGRIELKGSAHDFSTHRFEVVEQTLRFQKDG